jgi:CheY-like chemotaxis protein
MDGFEFLEAFQRRYGTLTDRTPICILTSSASASDVLKAKQYNLAGFITKPLTPASLTAVLEKL